MAVAFPRASSVFEFTQGTQQLCSTLVHNRCRVHPLREEATPVV